MAKAFTTMQDNVANFCQDTSSAFKTKAGIWINEGYQDAHKRHMWESLINHDYTFNSVIDQEEYDLPADFEEELFLANIVAACRLKAYTVQGWWDVRYSAHNDEKIPSGTPERYIILYETSKLKLDPAPLKVEKYAMPYKKTVADLIGSGTSEIRDIDTYLEHYAISQGFAYKREFQKSDYYLNKAEYELQKVIENATSRANRQGQFTGRDYGASSLSIGDSNYGL
jgi:hypothetical protein